MKWLSNLISWILTFWNKIPEQTKEIVVKIISETFRTLLEKYYDWLKSKEKNEKEKSKQSESKNK